MRLIYVGNPLRKIKKKTVKTRIESAVKRIKEQCGFSMGRYVYTIHLQLPEKFKGKSKNIRLLFIVQQSL